MAKKPKSSFDDEDNGPGPDEFDTPDKPGPPDQPPPDKPGPPDKPPDEPQPLEREQAEQLMRAGHRLYRIGDPKEKWFTGTRYMNQLVVSQPLTQELEDELFSKPVALAE